MWQRHLWRGARNGREFYAQPSSLYLEQKQTFGVKTKFEIQILTINFSNQIFKIQIDIKNQNSIDVFTINRKKHDFGYTKTHHRLTNEKLRSILMKY